MPAHRCRFMTEALAAAQARLGRAVDALRAAGFFAVDPEIGPAERIARLRAPATAALRDELDAAQCDLAAAWIAQPRGSDTP